MPILFDFNKDTGVSEYFDYDPISDQVFLTYKQDVTQFLDRMAAIRNNPEISKKGMKEEWWYYCSVPEVVELELMKKGLFLHNKDHIKPILKEINSNYQKLKATDKNHS